jgi:hypothetical protein
VDRTGLASRPVADFGISGVEPSVHLHPNVNYQNVFRNSWKFVGTEYRG